MKNFPSPPPRPAPWEKPTIELPPGWKSAVERLALEINGGKKGMMRYVWAVACDLVLELDRNEVKNRARDLQRLDADDLSEVVMRHCEDATVAARFGEKPTTRRARD